MSAALDLERLLDQSGALLSGHFALSSGLHSDRYVQCALLLERPERARAVGRELASRLERHAPQSVLSPALGGLVIGHEVAEALGVPFRFSERTATGDMALRRGFALSAGERVAIVEDVVTTGRSTLETAALVEAAGATLAAVGAILDRTGGDSPFAVPFASLMRLEIASRPRADCPQCARGVPVDKPGSRR